MTTAETEIVTLAPYGSDPQTGAAYPPHPTQQLVSRWVQSVRRGQWPGTGLPVLYLQHGVDAGGTRAVLTPVLECLLELPGIRVLIGRKDFNDLRLSVMETFLEIVPSVVIIERNEQEHRYVLAGSDGPSTVFFRELKDVKGLGSQEFAIITVHEAHEIDLPAYRTLKQRCRQAGYPQMILMEGNPPAAEHWLEHATDPHHVEYDPDIARIILPSSENYAFMSASYRTMLEAMPAAWKRRYLLGETGALPDGTPVYPAFVEAVHRRETALIPDRPIVRGWDFGYRRAACVWGQRADNGQTPWHREWMALETPEDAFIEGVKVRTKEWFGDRVCQDFGDPAATQRDPHGIATLTRLTQHGVQLRYRPTTYAERIPLINRKLSELVMGQPAVIINPACQILGEGLAGGYHYPKLVEGHALTTQKQIPFKDGWFEHIANAFEYAMIGLWSGAPSSEVTAFRSRIKRQQRQMASRQTAAVF